MSSALSQAGLVLVTRYPEPGYTKTRLIPCLGRIGAANIQRLMTEHVLQQVVALPQQHSITVEVHFTGGTLAQMQTWLGPQAVYRPQCEGSLGDRLKHIFQQGFARGLERIIVIGCDCPSVQPQQVLRALDLLNTQQMVLGPATDGGYYLIGLSRQVPELFQDIAWGTGQVFQQTVAIAQQLNLQMDFLEMLADVDRPEDLPIWQRIFSHLRR